MEELTARAERIFPGSTIIMTETYEIAKERMLSWIKSLKEWTDAVTRWALACEGAWQALTFPKPYCEWADRLLSTDLTDMLNKLHAANLAQDYPTAYPPTWAIRPTFKFSDKMDTFKAQIFIQSLG